MKASELKIKALLEDIRMQLGLEFEDLGDSNKKKKYFNIAINEACFISNEYNQLVKYSEKYKTFRVEPNGHKRLAIFFVY